jgi:hypothetical protein
MNLLNDDIDDIHIAAKLKEEKRKEKETEVT